MRTQWNDDGLILMDTITPSYECFPLCTLEERDSLCAGVVKANVGIELITSYNTSALLLRQLLQADTWSADGSAMENRYSLASYCYSYPKSLLIAIDNRT